MATGKGEPDLARGEPDLARDQPDPARDERGPARDEPDPARIEPDADRIESEPARDQANPGRPALPDRLSVDPSSPYHVPSVFEHAVGIRFNGKERFGVEEYCRSEGWIKVPAGKALDRKGRPMLIKLKGEVEAFYK
jgi:hypothetical protein